MYNTEVKCISKESSFIFDKNNNKVVELLVDDVVNCRVDRHYIYLMTQKFYCTKFSKSFIGSENIDYKIIVLILYDNLINLGFYGLLYQIVISIDGIGLVGLSYWIISFDALCMLKFIFIEEDILPFGNNRYYMNLQN
ncbi:hypothetical protein BCR32DRAFT_278051 [Anaeromyces robustus]|uniref:Uncharacterized protein n=1 Tax=Anaeromyces robustus TaxID=1754192 RepID=A0A1Y1XD43_9FUNG|nr:hypothetical protein BCR32DRAFT_278051 [Anaeromyces robustus]|eukprot:ORX83356.1 hypothetical protein BCR32DRAFT_278051 [Anaeromyces robustus]